MRERRSGSFYTGLGVLRDKMSSKGALEQRGGKAAGLSTAVSWHSQDGRSAASELGCPWAELQSTDRDANGLEVMCIFEVPDFARGCQQRLGGHAAAIYTGPTDVMPLHNADLETLQVNLELPVRPLCSKPYRLVSVPVEL